MTGRDCMDFNTKEILDIKEKMSIIILDRERRNKMIIYLYILIGCAILFINIFNGLLVWTNNVNNTLCKIAENSAIIFLIITTIILLCL